MTDTIKTDTEAKRMSLRDPKRPKPSLKKSSITVAEFVEAQVDLCGKSQKQIAEEAGFPKPNIITMFKNGDTKIPLEKIGRFAKAICVDPVHLFKLCMAEYHPDTWNEIEVMIDQPVLTVNEIEILEVVRSANVVNPRVRTEEERNRVRTAIESLKPDNAIND
jgi:hypothetical protein